MGSLYGSLGLEAEVGWAQCAETGMVERENIHVPESLILYT